LANADFRVPLILVARSGTGKTTLALFRAMKLLSSGISRWVFVTASPVLRGRIRTLFRSLQRGMGAAGRANAAAAERLDAAGGPRSLKLIPSDAWPLFLTCGEWLSLLDATSEHPFAPRKLDGSLKYPDRAPASWRIGAEVAAAVKAAATKSGHEEVDFRLFSSALRLAPAMLKNAHLHGSLAAAVWREIVSFIKVRSSAHAGLRSL